MKKSLSKVLARMAKDGDPETVAEIIEEMISPEGSEAAGDETGEGTAAPETPEEAAAQDDAGLEEILARLDQIICLLTPPALDEDPAEAVAEAVEEAMEAVRADPAAGEVSAVMEEILDPVASVVLEEDEEEQELPETMQTGDALRAALKAVRPVLARMPRSMRQKAAGDIAARIRRGTGRGTTGRDAYAALASAGRRTAPVSAELGRRIMASRNPNYRCAGR